MIHSVLIFNNDSLPRLMKFYTPVDVETQNELLRQVYQLVNQRQPYQSSFLTPPPLLEGIEDIKVIYRHYATLYFVFIVDDQESELGILDLIQVFVQSLDKCFENVREIDLVFGWQVLQTVLEEIVQGGMVIETNIANIVAVSEFDSIFKTSRLLTLEQAVDAANREKSSLSSSYALANATSALSALTKDGRFAWPGR